MKTFHVFWRNIAFYCLVCYNENDMIYLCNRSRYMIAGVNLHYEDKRNIQCNFHFI